MPGALISKGDLMLFTGSADTRGAPSLNTDYLDVDKIVDVPDTPERVYIGQEDIETDSSSGTGHPRNSVFTYGAMERKDGNNQIASEMRRKENLHPHHGRQFDDSDQMPRPSVQAVGSSSINRIVGKAKREGRYDVGTQQGGDRMAECSKILSVPSKRKGIVETNSLPNDFKAQKRREGSLVINGVSSHTVGDTSKSSNHASKGKAKVGDHNDGHFEVSGRGTGELSHDGVSERKSGKSASVPLRTVVVPSMMGRKKLVRHGCISPHNIAKAKASLESSSDFGNVKTPVASGGTRHETNANKATAKENNLDQFKGKGFLFRPCSSREYELRNAASFDRKDTVGSSANQQHKGSIQDTDDIFQRASNSQAGDLCIKGQKKCDVGSSSQKSKREIMRLGSQEALSSRSTGRSPQIIEIPELAPEVRQRSSMTDDDLEARVRQVQADEMFACELQEQLYNEVTEVASVESGALMSHARRQPRSRTLHRRSVHRGTQAHIPTSRTRGLRDRIARRSSAVPFRQRHILFPSEMDLDMRLELLEAMEAVVDYDIRMVNQLLDSDREFNENDYETLLALDENNHQHVGASFDQVANLPQSIVQSDSFEDCSICLETPAIGDTIRHLPCLHKFHKDCIDPWLRRKRSCPVCKSDIT